MESLQNLDEMRIELELLEEEETKIDLELDVLIKQQPDLLVKGKYKIRNFAVISYHIFLLRIGIF